MKANAVGTHFIESDAGEIKYVVEVVRFPYCEEHQQVVEAEHEDHPVENAEEEVFIEGIGE